MHDPVDVIDRMVELGVGPTRCPQLRPMAPHMVLDDRPEVELPVQDLGLLPLAAATRSMPVSRMNWLRPPWMSSARRRTTTGLRPDRASM